MSDPVPSSRPLLILGMHRSGTSMLARLLQEAGVHLGEDLIGPAAGNPRGHFEDRAVHDFHLRCLARWRDEDKRLWDDGTLCPRAEPFQPTDGECAEAAGLARRLARPGWWGWKEPRTCLFLDLWLPLLPEARCIVIYRHPLEVHFSHLRRGSNLDLLFFPEQALEACAIYNAALLRACQAQPERFLIINASRALRDRARLADLLGSFLEWPAANFERAGDFHPEEFSTLAMAGAHDRLWQRIHPASHQAYAQLEALAVLPSPASEAATAPAWLDKLVEAWDSPTPYGNPLSGALLGLLERSFSNPTPQETARWRLSMARTLLEKSRHLETWAVQSVNEQKAYIEQMEKTLLTVDAERIQMGREFEKERAHSGKIWSELVNVGHDWHRQQNRIAELEAIGRQQREEIQTLRQRWEASDGRGG